MNLVRAFRARLQRVHADHHAIARSMLWIVFFAFLGRIAGAAKEMVVAYRYGISEVVDSYILIFNLINVPIGIWFGVLTVVLVPLAARIRNDQSLELPRFRAELLGLGLILAVSFLGMAWLSLSYLMSSSWLGLPQATTRVAEKMVPGLVALAPLGVVVSLFSAWIMSSGRHTNTLLESIPALVLMAVVIVFPSGGPEALVWGIVAGATLHLISLTVPLAWLREIETPRFTRQSPYWIPFWQGFGIMLAGQALMSIVSIVDQFFAARLGAGAIATLGYASRILALLLALGAMAVSRATLPVFSKAQALGAGQSHMARVATHWARLLFGLGLAAAVIGWWLAPWIVRLLFERGAFTSKDTEAVMEVLRFGLPQIPFYFSALVFVSLATSQRKYKLIFWSGVIGIVCKLTSNAILIPILGIGGIALAWAVVYAINALFFWVALGRSK